MKYFFNIITLIVILFSTNYAQNQSVSFLEDEYIQAPDMIIDVVHTKVDITIDPYKQIVDGKAWVKFNTLQPECDSIIFTTPYMNFKKVIINNLEFKFNKKDNLTIIYIPDKLKNLTSNEIIIEYQSNPQDGLYFTGWNDPQQKMRKQIWAHSPSGWFPFINQKHDILTTEVIVTFDSKYKVFSNGDRLDIKDNKNGTSTWHYKIDKPHVVYLICLVIGDYDYKTSKSKNGTPIELWYYPDQKDRFDIAYIYQEKMFDFFDSEIGVKYPWNSYRQAPANDYLFGGMETTTATIYGDYMFVDKRAWWMRNYVNVNAHELNHQWFGNYISHLNNRHTWLTESFATYYAKLFEKSIYGEDYYQWERDKELIRTFNAAKINNNPVMHSAAGTDRWYPKGSLVLDMMRYVLGDDAFRKSIKNYVEKNANQVTETYDLLKSIRYNSGKSLDWFFDEWLYRGGEPHYKVSYSQVQEKGNYQTQFKIEQIHKTDNLIKFFKMPINIDIYYKDGSVQSKQFWVEGKQTDIKITNNFNKEIDFVIFDPNRQIIKKLTFDRTFEELSSQLLKAKNMIDRYDALLAMKEISIDIKRETLQKSFNNEKFHLIKSEIVAQLSNDDKSIDLVKLAILDKDALVRKSCLDNIKKISPMLKNDYEKLLTDSSYTNVELALENLCNSFPENNDAYLEITKNEEGWRGRNIRIKWLEIAISNGRTDFTKELIDYTTESYDFETRINAFNTLKTLNLCNNEIAQNLIKAKNYWHFKLTGVAKDVIEFFKQQKKYKNLF